MSHLEAFSGTGTSGACPYNRSASRRRPLLDHGMVGVLIHRREQAFERRLAAEGAAALLDVRAELVAALDDVRRDRQRRGVAERAEALPEDAVTDAEQQREVGVCGFTGPDRRGQLRPPACPFAARR